MDQKEWIQKYGSKRMAPKETIPGEDQEQEQTEQTRTTPALGQNQDQIQNLQQPNPTLLQIQKQIQNVLQHPVVVTQQHLLQAYQPERSVNNGSQPPPNNGPRMNWPSTKQTSPPMPSKASPTLKTGGTWFQRQIGTNSRPNHEASDPGQAVQ